MNTKWTKTKDLSVGMKIAAADLDRQGMFWDEIVSIQPVGRQRVWDIEVEGTHNFVGNQLIAHNTYINSSATTGVSLDMDANSLTTGTGLDLSSTANGYTTGKILNVDLTQSAATGTSVSGNISAINFAPTYSTAVTTPAVSGNTLSVTRTATTNSLFASTLTVSGALASFSDSATQTTGTLTSTADVVRIAQNYTSNSGSALNLTSAGTGLAMRVNDDGTFTDTTAFVVDSSGQVGIGTSTPQAGYKLDVNGTSFFRGSLEFNGVGDEILSNGDVTINGNGIIFKTGSVEKVRIENSSGNVGIGTTAPTGKLHVSGAVTGKALAIFDETGDQDILTASASGATKYTISRTGAVTQAGALTVSAGGADITGNVDISGTLTSGTANAFTIDATGNISSSGTTGLTLSGNSAKITFSGTGANQITTAASQNLALMPGGNLGIGTTSPVGKLHLDGAVTGKALAIFNETGDQSPFTASVSGVTKFLIENDGDVVITGSGTTCTIGNGTGATNCTSDVRLKSNISDLGSALDRILQLRPVNFTWADPAKPQSNHLGLIAQDVQPLFPELVATVYDDYQGIDYAALVVPLVKSVQELDAKIQANPTQVPSQPRDEVADQTILNNLKVNQSAEVSIDLRVLGQLHVLGALTVTGEVNLLGQVFFNSDTAGFAAIPLGARYVTVTFDREYLSSPIVTASPVWDTDAQVLGTAIDQPVSLLPQQDYIIAASNTSGFTILLEQPAVIDLKFSWTAIAVKNPRTISGIAPTPTPSPTPIISPSIAPEPTLTPTPTPPTP